MISLLVFVKTGLFSLIMTGRKLFVKGFFSPLVKGGNFVSEQRELTKLGGLFFESLESHNNPPNFVDSLVALRLRSSTKFLPLTRGGYIFCLREI